MQKIADMVEPPNYTGRNAEGHYCVEASIFYGDLIFKARFAIHASGMIDMLSDDEVLLDNVAGKIDAPIS
jgi:hypothetical protein